MSPSTPTHYEGLSPSTIQTLGFLGRALRYGEFEQVCNDIKRHTIQELWEIAAREGPRTCKHYKMLLNLTEICHTDLVLAINVSGSQRSSLTTSSSIFSRDSRISTESYASSVPAAHGTGYQTQPTGSEYHGHAATSLPQIFPDVHDSPHANQTSPYSQTAQANSEMHYCLTCKKCYTDQVGLKKHQKEKCESTGYWLCLRCLNSPSKRWITFGREYRLREHHQKEHEEQADLDMDKAIRKYPPQKVWGCPCCLTCFSSRKEWHNHEENHIQAVHWDGKNGDTLINGWSWMTLFGSLLLRSSFLKDAASRYDWESCNWRQGEEICRKVKFVLERYELPPDTARYHDNSPLRTAEDFVSYAYQMLTVGKFDFQQLPSSNARKTAVLPIVSNTPGANTQRKGTDAHIHKDLRFLTQSVGHHTANLNGCGAENEHQSDHDGGQPSTGCDATMQMSAEPAHRWPFEIESNPLYNASFRQDGLQVPEYPGAQSGLLTQSCHSPLATEPKKLKGKWSLRNLRGCPTGIKGQLSTTMPLHIPLADFQAAAASTALTPQDIFGIMSSQVSQQDPSTDFLMTTETSGNHSTWFDQGSEGIPHAIAAGQLPSNKLAYFDPGIGPQNGQY